MYKRYYDGYGVAPDCALRGEIITPKCTEELNEGTQKGEHIGNICNNAKTKNECCTEAGNQSTSYSECTPSPSSAPCCATQKPKRDNPLGNIEIDDIILLAIILIMLKEGTEDSTLIIVLGAIFLFGFID